jgi:rare lipoprotein A
MQPFERDHRSYRAAYALTLSAACLALAGCAAGNVASRSGNAHDVAAASPDHPASESTAPKRHAAAHTHHDASYSAVGLASWYGADFHGRRTADGDTFDMHSLTAAHRTLPLPCTVRVTNLSNNRSVLVRVNDRGPFIGNRLIDLSAQSAKVLGFYDRGLAKVKVDYVGRASRPSVSSAPPAPPTPRITAAATPPL